MIDIDELFKLGIFSQLIPVWQILFFIASLLPFLLCNRVKICLLITYLFTYYLGFMIIFGEHLARAGSMQPFVLYALSGLTIAVLFVATIFTEGGPEQTRVRWVRYARSSGDDASSEMGQRDPVEMAVNVTQVSDTEVR
jgi:hypothetical protein